MIRFPQHKDEQSLSAWISSNERLRLELSAFQPAAVREALVSRNTADRRAVVGKTNRDRYVGGGFGCEGQDRKKTKTKKMKKEEEQEEQEEKEEEEEEKEEKEEKKA